MQIDKMFEDATRRQEFSLPQPVVKLLSTIENHGYEAYVVGGAVRDLLLDDVPDDYDVTTSATPEEVQTIFGEKACHLTGISHGTITVVVDSCPIEVTTFRVESTYSDARHPDEVHFTRSLQEDVKRRDFTINAMALDVHGNLVDECGGQEDLRRGLIRTVGDPKVRFEEDALRILRALRFASEHGFAIEENTAREILAQKDALARLSVERIWKEFSRLLCGMYCVPILRRYFDVFTVFIPELAPMQGFDQRNPHHIYDVWEHTLVSVISVRAELILRLTMLLHDIGKPACFTTDADGVGHFLGHMRISAEMADGILRRLKVDNETRETTVLLIKAHDVAMTPVSIRIIRRRLAQYGETNLRRLLEVKRADTMAHSPKSAYRLIELDHFEELLDKVLEEKMCFSFDELAITGKDLIRIGMKPGVGIGQVKKQLLNEVIDGQLQNEKEILLARAQELRKTL